MLPLRWLQFLAILWLGDVHTVLSSTAPFSSCGLMPINSFMESICLIRGLPLVLLLFFLVLLSFPENPAFSWFAPNWIASVLSFWTPPMFQASFSLVPTCSCFWWSGIFLEFFFNTLLQMNRYISYQHFPLSNTYIHSMYPYTGNMRVWITFALVSKDTS